MSKKRYFICLAAAISAFGLIGRADADGPGWVMNRTVIAIVHTNNGGFNVRLSPDLTGCVSQSGYGPNYGSVYPSQAFIDRMKADFLVAFATGKPMSVYLADSQCKIAETILGLYF